MAVTETSIPIVLDALASRISSYAAEQIEVVLIKSQSEIRNDGVMVIVHSMSQPPLTWRLGWITEVHPGNNGVVRVATIKTAERKSTRPVVTLVKLPTA